MVETADPVMVQASEFHSAILRIDVIKSKVTAVENKKANKSTRSTHSKARGS